MSNRFTLNIYNHSSQEIEFELSNNRCMILPAVTKRRAAPRSWIKFDDLETSNSIVNACVVSENRFNITASQAPMELRATDMGITIPTPDKDRKQLANATYRVYSTNKYRHFGSLLKPGSTMSAEVKPSHSFSSDFPRVESLVFVKTDSYGDLFFNGRGIYVANDIKHGMRGESVGNPDEQNSFDNVDEMRPTALVNSNKQFLENVDDDALANVISRLVAAGTKVVDVYSFVSSLNKGGSKEPSENEKAWNFLNELMVGYYTAYKSTVTSSDEMSVYVRPDNGVDGSSTAFHLVFADSTLHAAAIMAGDFYLPPPPDNNNTFYQNILHLSQKDQES